MLQTGVPKVSSAKRKLAVDRLAGVRELLDGEAVARRGAGERIMR